MRFNMTLQYTIGGTYKLFICVQVLIGTAGDDDSGPYEPRMIAILSAGARSKLHPSTRWVFS